MKINTLQLCLLIFLLILSELASAGKSDLEKSEEYVNSFLSPNNKNMQQWSADPIIELTKLLRGMAGVELEINFKTNSADISRKGRERIYALSKLMWVYPDPMVRFTLGAYSDVRGTEAYNIKLAKKRLDAVLHVFQDALGKEYNSKRFYTAVYGEKYASHKDGKDNEGMFFDRKVTIVLLIQSNKQY